MSKFISKSLYLFSYNSSSLFVVWDFFPGFLCLGLSSNLSVFFSFGFLESLSLIFWFSLSAFVFLCFLFEAVLFFLEGASNDSDKFFKCEVFFSLNNNLLSDDSESKSWFNSSLNLSYLSLFLFSWFSESLFFSIYRSFLLSLSVKSNECKIFLFSLFFVNLVLIYNHYLQNI